MTNSTSSADAPYAGRSHVAYNLAGIALLLLLAAVGAAYLIDLAARNTHITAPVIDDSKSLTQTVGGQELTIPASWFRYREQMRSGFASQVDLEVQLKLLENGPALPVQVTLLPSNKARASSVLLDTVYLHQFGEGTIGGYAGLVGKPLLASDGYSGETVWYDPLSPVPFVAKCAIPVTDQGEGRCLRTVHLPGGLAAIFTFDRTALAAWRAFDPEMARWLGQIGAL